jgi:PAS domain S-box-containing protein
MARYSYYGLDDAWASFDLMEAAERTRRRAWGISVLAIAVALALWLASFLSQRRRAETKLRKSEERFRATFFQAAMGIAQTRLQGEWLLLNNRFSEIVGYTQAELRGKTFVDITHPDDREANIVARRQFLAGEISSWSVEKRYIHKNGATVWARVHVSLVRDQHHVPQYFISVVEDITDRVEAERALRDSERRLALAQSAAHLGQWDWDLRTNAHAVSGEYLSLYGLPADYPSPTYEEWLSLIHPDDCKRVQAAQQESIEHTHAWDTEFRVVWPNGSIHWLLGKGTVFLDDSGQPVRMAGVNLDITERKQVEEVRSHLAAIVESSDDAIIGKTLDGVVVSWNPGAERIYGYRAGEMVGQPISLLVPPDRPDEVPQMLKRLPQGGHLERFETARVRKDGRRIEVSVTISPVRDSTGAVVGASVIARDITEQKAAEAALRESEEHFRNMADSAPVMIWICDPEKLCTFVNKGWLDFTGRSLERELGNGWAESVHPEDRDRCLANFSSSFDSRRRFQIEYRLRCADGEYRRVLDNGVPFYREDVFVGYIGSCIDITDQRRAELALRRSLDEISHLNRVAGMGELTASLAHELNQPLAAIISNAQAAIRFLGDESPDLAQVRECLSDIVADDKRAGEVIKRLRALLKKGKYQASLVDLNEVVSEAIRLLRNDTMLRNVSVSFETFPSLPPVLGDRIQLYQVALNLIVNGLDAVAERPPGNRWVLVRTAEADGGRVELRVEDSGNGVAASDLAHVFEPFFTTKRDGLGMGLSISRSIVQAHGGQIWAESGAEGGAIFHCVLPVAQQGAVASGEMNPSGNGTATT